MKKISVSTAVAIVLGLLLFMVLVSVKQPFYYVAKVPQQYDQEQTTVPEPDQVLHHNQINKQGHTSELRLSESKGNLQPEVRRKATDGLKVFQNLSRGMLKQEKYGKYKRGKRITYETLYRCKSPEFLDDHKSPCWKSERFSAEDKTYCGPRVTLLGFHKCGSTDLSKWFKDPDYSAINTDFFIKELGKMCPHEFMESRKRMFVKSSDITTYGDCPGCLIINQVLRVGPNDVVLHSVAQYIQYLRKDNSRYIITMRNPTDRVLSHYFYSFKVKQQPDYSIYKAGKTPEDIGYDVLHDVVTKTVESLKECLGKDGVTECIVTPLKRNSHVEDSFMASILAFSCYSAFIREVLKFLPKDHIYFSKMEDYAVHPEIVVPELFKFLGEDAGKINMALANQVKNTGVTVKPVHQKTIDLLDEFFEPFNEELAAMIGNEKWKFKR